MLGDGTVSFTLLVSVDLGIYMCMVQLLTVQAAAGMAEARAQMKRPVRPVELLVDVALGRLGTCSYGIEHSQGVWEWTP
jgi:hypothetical protein